MRLALLTLIFVTSIFANESTEYFKKDKANKVFCHVGQYSYKMLSQKDATLVKVNGHEYFKIKDENLYFLSNSCQPIKGSKKLLGF